jgi:hypothetical protein
MIEDYLDGQKIFSAHVASQAGFCKRPGIIEIEGVTLALVNAPQGQAWVPQVPQPEQYLYTHHIITSSYPPDIGLGGKAVVLKRSVPHGDHENEGRECQGRFYDPTAPGNTYPFYLL